MMKAAKFILKWRGGAVADKGTIDEDTTRIWLVGPFDTEDAASHWARKDQEEDGDDPRWQGVSLLIGPHQTIFTLTILPAKAALTKALGP